MHCVHIKIGIYKIFGIGANQCIFISLREAQHLLHVLIRFVEFVDEVCHSDKDRALLLRKKCREENCLFHPNEKPQIITFSSVNFKKYGIYSISDYKNSTELIKDKIEILSIRSSQNPHNKRHWSYVGSLALSAFTYHHNGPYYVKITKLSLCRPRNNSKCLRSTAFDSDAHTANR
jgi:hypothetical protein